MQSAITVNTRVIKLFMRRTDATYIPLQGGLSLQILPSMAAIPTCQKHHFAAFIQDCSLLVVWDDDPKHLLIRAKEIENQLLKMIWESDTSEPLDEKKDTDVNVNEVSSDSNFDPEAIVRPRKLVLTQCILTGLTLMLLVSAIGSGWRNIAQEIMIDGSMMRVVFAAIVPLQVWLALVRLLQSLLTLPLLTILYSSSCNQSSAAWLRSWVPLTR